MRLCLVDAVYYCTYCYTEPGNRTQALLFFFEM